MLEFLAPLLEALGLIPQAAAKAAEAAAAPAEAAATVASAPLQAAGAVANAASAPLAVGAAGADIVGQVAQGIATPMQAIGSAGKVMEAAGTALTPFAAMGAPAGALLQLGQQAQNVAKASEQFPLAAAHYLHQAGFDVPYVKPIEIKTPETPISLPAEPTQEVSTEAKSTTKAIVPAKSKAIIGKQAEKVIVQKGRNKNKLLELLMAKKLREKGKSASPLLMGATTQQSTNINLLPSLGELNLGEGLGNFLQELGRDIFGLPGRLGKLALEPIYKTLEDTENYIKDLAEKSDLDYDFYRERIRWYDPRTWLPDITTEEGRSAQQHILASALIPPLDIARTATGIPLTAAKMLERAGEQLTEPTNWRRLLPNLLGNIPSNDEGISLFPLGQ